ncbi:POTRA domain protein, FtsQ-type [Actinomyces sp. oral taxon 848 str. F0332]|uniref:POTRA domain-containing protein n=1 Tax=Peptidiphaga gingivicola TaxID=2741497 RepID=A0A179B1N9_9ACTO|nr:FtsQ-type POTRA domain-containing protein [Peptidiphaga gingivicola]EEZ77449.1 POTRA domain protein, FtsQ-type [Actinomyces sp. oral taxon 848 str. F0332]OAP85295.1 hypothetical protein A4H34_09320 [Peptidiphaga gingivicola]
MEEGARRPEEESRRERPEAASSLSPSSPSEARTGEQAAVSGVAGLGPRRATGLAGAGRRGEPNLASENRDRRGQAVVAEIVEGGPPRGWRAASRRESDPVDMTERRRERLAERRRVRKRRIVRASIAGAAVVILAWVVFFSPLLALRSGGVAVRGAGAAGVADGDVKAAVAEYVGTPLVRLNTGEVESKVRKSLPMVKRAKVTRNFPGGVTVAVTLRKPVACMVEKASCTAIDEDGVRLDVPKSQTSSLPKLKLADGDAPRATSIMGAVLGALDEGTRRQVASVQVTRAGQVAFTLSDGATVNWGGAEESAVKARVLKGLLSQKAKRYDVSAPHAPVTEN